MGIRPMLLEIMVLSHAKQEKLDREVIARSVGFSMKRDNATCNPEMVMDRSKIPCPFPT